MSLKLGIYKHTKSEKLYRVIGIGKDHETLEDLVFYEALYENPESQFWIRPLKMFVENINAMEGKKPRFSFIGNS